MKTLVIIGIERTGTNYLCSLLNHLPEVESRFELFANVASISLSSEEIDALSQTAHQTFTDKTDPALIQYLKEHTDVILSLLKQRGLAQRKLLSFKIFREHLPNGVMSNLIRENHVIFVTRRVLDTYISFIKALQAEVWINQDTTELKPTLNIKHFAYWYQQTLDYYTFCVGEYLKWKQELPIVLRYEEFTNGTNLENLNCVAHRVGRATGLQLDIPEKNFISVFHRQDQNNKVQHKVANWKEFEQQLRQHKLGRKAYSSFLLPSS